MIFDDSPNVLNRFNGIKAVMDRSQTGQRVQYAGLDEPIIEICGGTDDAKNGIMDDVENCKDAINNTNNIHSLIGEWRAKFETL